MALREQGSGLLCLMVAARNFDFSRYSYVELESSNKVPHTHTHTKTFIHQVQPSIHCDSNPNDAAKNSFVTSCVAFPDSKSHSPRHIYTSALGVWFHS